MMSRTITLEVDDIKLVGRLYLPAGQPPYPAVCVCHGIPAKNRAPGDGGYPRLAKRICREGFAVLIFNFRGSGDSGGNFDILGWARDLGVAIDYLAALPEVDRSRLALLGFSGGAAVAVYRAAQDKRVSSVLTCACPAEFTFFTEVDDPQSVIDHFRSIGMMRDRDFPPSMPVWLDGFRLICPLEYIAGIAPRPVLLVHGSQDETVDVSHAGKLYERAKEPKQLVIIAGAGHRLRQNDEAVAVVIDWLNSRV